MDYKDCNEAVLRIVLNIDMEKGKKYQETQKQPQVIYRLYVIDVIWVRVIKLTKI